MSRFPLTAFAFAAALLVQGCGRESAPLPAPERGEARTADQTVYPESDYVSDGEGREGGILRLSTSTDTAILDPHGVSATYIQWFGRLVFDNLVYLDPKGNATPWLARSWEISPDGLVYTFHLRDDVTFSDGSKFNAEAVRINLEHMRDPATRPTLTARYIAPYVEGRVIDDYTFEARLRQPYGPFLNVLAQSWLAMISPRQILEDPRSAVVAPIGSGPFILERYQRQQGLSFTRRADYHWAPAFIQHQGPARVERIQVDIIPEAFLRYSGLMSGQHDLTLEAPAQNARAIRGDARFVLDRRARQGVPYRGITFNTQRAPFDDVRVRRALAHAVDREGIAQMMGFGEYTPKGDFLSITTPYYDPAYRDRLVHDLAEANRLLDDAGWTDRDSEGYRTRNGVRLGAEILASEALAPSSIIVAIQADVKKVGFELRLRELQATQLAEFRATGDYQALTAGVWHTNTPDALYIVHHSDGIPNPPQTGQNTSRISDADFDGYVADARRATDPVLLKELYSKAQGRLVDLVPAIPLYENYSLIAYRKRVRGLIFDTSHYVPLFTAAWIEEEKS